MDDITVAGEPEACDYLGTCLLEEFQTTGGELSWYLGCAFERDRKPHSVRKDTKPASKPCMSMGSTAIPGGSAISSRGQTSFFAIAVVKCFAFDKGCKWPKQRHFIDADIRPRFILCYNSLYFEVQKEKNGDRGTIVFTATLRFAARLMIYDF